MKTKLIQFGDRAGEPPPSTSQAVDRALDLPRVEPPESALAETRGSLAVCNHALATMETVVTDTAANEERGKDRARVIRLPASPRWPGALLLVLAVAALAVIVFGVQEGLKGPGSGLDMLARMAFHQDEQIASSAGPGSQTAIMEKK